MGNLSAIGMGRLAGLAFVGVVGVGVTIDRGMNYTKTEGVITATATDCYVEGKDREIVNRTTNKRAYMPCEEAPLAAEAFGYAPSDVHFRTKISYDYVSPIDRKTYSGHYEANNATSADSYKIGARYKILAHKKEPNKSQWDYGRVETPAVAQSTSPSVAVAAKPVGLRGKL
jgi:hypothetical protein